MKKTIIIFFLSLSIALTFGCSKKDKELTNDENLGTTIDQEEEKGKKVQESQESQEIEEIEEIEEAQEIPMEKEYPELPLEEEQPDLSIDDSENIIYRDDLYDFSLELPKEWEGKYNVEKKPWIDGSSDSVEFNFVSGNISNNIFTIVIMNESIPEAEWQELFLIYIMENSGKTYSYLNIMEPTEELLKEENKSELETVTNMVERVPQVIESFNIEN